VAKKAQYKVHNEFAQEWEPDKKILLEAFGSENELLVESLAKNNYNRRQRLEGQRTLSPSSIWKGIQDSGRHPKPTLKLDQRKEIVIPHPPLELMADVQEFHCIICLQKVRNVKNMHDWK